MELSPLHLNDQRRTLGKGGVDGGVGAANAPGDENEALHAQHLAGGIHGAGHHGWVHIKQRHTAHHGQETVAHPLLAQAVG